jgi:membrane protease YdiL (CAAX protease family)
MGRPGKGAAILLLQLLTSGLGEEPGWRGYLLPRLQERFSPIRSVWLLGLAWAVWHYPLTAIYALSGVPADAPAPAGVITVVIALLSQTIGIIGLTSVYVWLFNRTRSIFLMIVFHALTNALPFLVPPTLGPWAFVVGVLPWIVVLVLWLVTGSGLLAFTSWGPDT